MMFRTTLAAALMAGSLILPALAHEGDKPADNQSAATVQTSQATPDQLSQEMAQPDNNGE